MVFGNQSQDSRFSNIEELDAENDTESDQPNGTPAWKKINVENLDTNNSNLEEGTESNIMGPAQTALTLKNQHSQEEELDKLIIRDATEDELSQLEQMTREMLNNANEKEESFGRCSLIQMTPRDSSICNTDREGMDSARGHTQLTGLKPKALVFASPLKSPPERKTKVLADTGIYSNASTKAGTASAGGGNAGSATFGLSNCLYKCEVNEGEGSPDVEMYKGDQNEAYVGPLKIPSSDILKEISQDVMNSQNMIANEDMYQD